MKFYSVNPYNGEQVGEYLALSGNELDEKLNKSAEVFKTWRQQPLSHRTALIKKAGQVLRENVEDYAQMITSEMGKPITESMAEVNKCAWVCDYYAENA